MLIWVMRVVFLNLMVSLLMIGESIWQYGQDGEQKRIRVGSVVVRTLMVNFVLFVFRGCIVKLWMLRGVWYFLQCGLFWMCFWGRWFWVLQCRYLMMIDFLFIVFLSFIDVLVLCFLWYWCYEGWIGQWYFLDFGFFVFYFVLVVCCLIFYCVIFIGIGFNICCKLFGFIFISSFLCLVLIQIMGRDRMDFFMQMGRIFCVLKGDVLFIMYFVWWLVVVGLQGWIFLMLRMWVSFLVFIEKKEVYFLFVGVMRFVIEE